MRKVVNWNLPRLFSLNNQAKPLSSISREYFHIGWEYRAVTGRLDFFTCRQRRSDVLCVTSATCSQQWDHRLLQSKVEEEGRDAATCLGAPIMCCIGIVRSICLRMRWQYSLSRQEEDLARLPSLRSRVGCYLHLLVQLSIKSSHDIQFTQFFLLSTL